MKTAWLIVPIVMAALAATTAQTQTTTMIAETPSGAVQSEAQVGAGVFYQACGLCHDDSEHMLNDNGPALFGVVGRRVGSVEGYDYSPALRKANRKGHVWTEARLDTFLAGPQHMYTGTNMPMMFNDPKVRHALIAYLKTLTPKL